MPRCSYLVCVLVLLHVGTAFAQSDPKAEASAHFKKGLEAFDGRRLQEAADEFETAYRLSPAYAVLYNIGKVDAALGRSVEAVQAYSRYLAQGGDSIPPKRRHEVLVEIEEQTSHIGTVTIFVRPPGAEIRADGKRLGESPLPESVHMTAGKHTIEVTLPNYVSQARDIDVAGGSQSTMQMDLDPVVVVSITPPPAPPPPVQPAAAQEISARDRTRTAGDDTTTSGSGQRIAGYVLGGAGVLAAGIGTVLALTAVGKANDAKNRLSHAASGDAWDAAKSDYDAAKDRNRLGWIVAGCGAAVAVAGAALVLTVPSPEQSTRVEVAPLLGARTAGIFARSHW